LHPGRTPPPAPAAGRIRTFPPGAGSPWWFFPVLWPSRDKKSCATPASEKFFAKGFQGRMAPL
jgi:hypothetical protein